jgi:hypothetical protein
MGSRRRSLRRQLRSSDEAPREPKNTGVGVEGAPPTVSLDGLAGQVDPSGTGVDEPSLRVVGKALAGWLIILTGSVLLLVALYAWMTYPHLGDIQGTVAAGSELDSYREYQAAWFTQVKDLLQLLVVSLLVPLLATVLGYIFGRQVEREA